MVTPYELLLALSTTHEWSGEYVLDYAPLLPRLAAAATAAEAAAEAAGGGGDSEDEAPDHSLVSGRLFSAAGAQERRAAKSGPGPQLAAVGGALVARGCHDLSATSGAEHLAGRSWRGLEQRLGEDEPAAVRPGRSGIASGFAGEGGAGAGAEARGAAAPAEPELVPPRHAAGVAARLTARSGERVAVTVRGVSRASVCDLSLSVTHSGLTHTPLSAHRLTPEARAAGFDGS